MTRIGTFEIIHARDGGFDVYDRDTFNTWDNGPKGSVTLASAIVWASWAHAFKTGRTFDGLTVWAERNAHRFA